MHKNMTAINATLRAARAHRDYVGSISRERIARLYAEAKAPAGGWKSRVIAMNPAYLDGIEDKLKTARRRLRYVRTPFEICAMTPQGTLDMYGTLVHRELTALS